MFKYLIVKCSELQDQYACDADRQIVGMTNDISEYNSCEDDHEIYELQEDGTFKLIKPYYGKIN